MIVIKTLWSYVPRGFCFFGKINQLVSRFALYDICELISFAK